MPKGKLQDRVARYLIEAKGFQEIPSTSRKYRKFMDPLNKGHFHFLGRNGAVRIGRTISGSRSLTAVVVRLMKVWEREQHEEDSHE